MEKTAYSTASHLIHFRMQLIRHKVEIVVRMQIAMLVFKNKQYFDAAAESVLKLHNITSEYKDIFDAAELFYNSTYPPPGK